MAIGEWLLGYCAGKIGNRMLKSMGGDALFRDLESGIERWRRTLPDEASLEVAAALFPSVKSDAELQARPSLAALRAELAKARVPGVEAWREALLEQWRKVRESIDDPQLFFQLPEADARAYLQALAVDLADICAQHGRLFQPTALALLLEIQAQLAALQPGSAIALAEANRPLTALAIAWTGLVEEIGASYRQAMDAGLPWPGHHRALTDDEFRHLSMLRAYLVGLQSADPDLLASLEAFRDPGLTPVERHRQRQFLLDRLALVEMQGKS